MYFNAVPLYLTSTPTNIFNMGGGTPFYGEFYGT